MADRTPAAGPAGRTTPKTPAARARGRGEQRREGGRAEVVEHPTLIAATVRKAAPQPRHYVALVTFVLLVLLPTTVVTTYLYMRAADQFASTVAFSIRNGDAALPAGLFGIMAQQVTSAGADAEIVYEFVRSQQMIEAARDALALEVIYNRPQDDVVFRLGEGRAIEGLVAYWNRMTDVSFDASTGIVRFEARAFTPEDARAVAAFVLAKSTEIVNDLSDQARADAIRVAEQAVAEAEDRLRGARRAMREFRDREQEIDPVDNAAATLGLVAELETELARARVALETEQNLIGPRSPRRLELEQRIRSLEKQIADERSRLGVGTRGGTAEGRRAYAGIISEYEERQVDLEFAQNAYTTALSAFEQAQIDARRQNRFLAPHIEPTLSVAPQYPQRGFLALTIFGLLLVGWAVLLLVIYNIRERR